MLELLNERSEFSRSYTPSFRSKRGGKDFILMYLIIYYTS